MNPLAAPLMELLTALWEDPRYKDVCTRAMQAHAAHANELLGAMQSGEKLAPILMQMAIHGFSEEDYEALEKAIQPRMEGKRRRATEAMKKVEYDMWIKDMEMRKQMLDQRNSTLWDAAQKPIKKPWYKP